MTPAPRTMTFICGPPPGVERRGGKAPLAPLPLSRGLRDSAGRVPRVAPSADPPPNRRIALQTAKPTVAVRVPERLWEIAPSAEPPGRPSLLQRDDSTASSA